MKLWARRAVLGAAVLGISGCAVSDPTIRTSDQPKTSPTQDATTAAALLAEGQLRERFTQLRQADFDLPEEAEAWASAQLDASNAHIARLRRGNPLTEGTKTNFDDPAATTTPAVDWELAAADVQTTAEAAQAAHRGAALQFAGTKQSLALFYGSLATSACYAAELTAAPVAGTAPGAVSDLTAIEADQLVLTWYWSLIYALAAGLGVLDHDTSLFKGGQARLDVVTQAADELTTALGSDAPERAAAYPHIEAATPAEVRASWADQESSLLSAMGRRFAAQTDPASQGAALDKMIEQGGRVLDWARPLTFWPGYV